MRELNSKALWASADLRGYRKGRDSFYLLNFWRAFPSEDPTVTRHLKESERGQSILWRSLRPELVRSNTVPLSPDANFLVTHGAADWQQQAQDARDATQRLVSEVRGVGIERMQKLRKTWSSHDSPRQPWWNAMKPLLCLSSARVVGSLVSSFISPAKVTGEACLTYDCVAG